MPCRRLLGRICGRLITVLTLDASGEPMSVCSGCLRLRLNFYRRRPLGRSCLGCLLPTLYFYFYLIGVVVRLMLRICLNTGWLLYPKAIQCFLSFPRLRWTRGKLFTPPALPCTAIRHFCCCCFLLLKVRTGSYPGILKEILVTWFLASPMRSSRLP